MRENIEIRNIQTEIRAVGDSRTIEALAIPVNSKSEFLFGKFYEIISPEAINDELIRANDVKLYLNHDMSQGTYARSKYGSGSLELFVTDEGLCFRTEIPATAFGDVVLEGIRRGDYDAISFAFIPDENLEVWGTDEYGNKTRTINKIKWLDEVSILSMQPAYAATKVNMRSYDEYVKKLEVEEEKEKEVHTRKLVKKLDALEEIINEM